MDQYSRGAARRRLHTIAAWGAVLFLAAFVRSFAQFSAWMSDPDWAFAHDAALVTTAFAVNALVQYWHRRDGYRPPNT